MWWEIKKEKMTTFGKSGSPKNAPKVKIANRKKNFMRENDDSKRGGKSPMAPMGKKRLSK